MNISASEIIMGVETAYCLIFAITQGLYRLPRTRHIPPEVNWHPMPYRKRYALLWVPCVTLNVLGIAWQARGPFWEASAATDWYIAIFTPIVGLLLLATFTLLLIRQVRRHERTYGAPMRTPS